jgi:hypothetical protein
MAQAVRGIAKSKTNFVYFRVLMLSSKSKPRAKNGTSPHFKKNQYFPKVTKELQTAATSRTDTDAVRVVR